MRSDDAWLLDMLLAAREAVTSAAPLTFRDLKTIACISWPF